MSIPHVSPKAGLLAALLVALASPVAFAQAGGDAPVPEAVAAPHATHDPGAATAAPVDPFGGFVPKAERPAGVPDPATPHPELAGVFAEFGGMPGMTALMDDFMVVMLADPRIGPFFEKVDQPRVKRQLAEQFCALLGGGCVYTGRDMKSSHDAFAIDRADFNALVEDLQIAMQRRGIPFRAQNRLLALLAPMHREVINR